MASGEWRVASIRYSPLPIRQPSLSAAPYSPTFLCPSRVRDALLGEARLGGSMELLVGGLLVAGSGGVGRAFLDEAVFGGAGELLVGRLRGAGGIGECERWGAQQHQRQAGAKHGFHHGFVLLENRPAFAAELSIAEAGLASNRGSLQISLENSSPIGVRRCPRPAAAFLTTFPG